MINANTAPPPGVVVIGMHRSATSLTTSVLIGCGWAASGRMLGAAPDNTRGYFEDSAIHALHRRLLRAHGTWWGSAGKLREMRRTEPSLEPEEVDVDQLVANLRAGDPWVWKNPRATLFVEDWARRLPEATFVICVRSPAAVVDSILRRGTVLRLNDNARLARSRRVLRALSVWHSYNVIAYRFARRHPQRAVIMRVPDDLPLLERATDPPLFDPKLISATPPRWARLACALAPRSQLLYRRLRRMHDSAALRRLLAGPPADRSTTSDRSVTAGPD